MLRIALLSLALILPQAAACETLAQLRAGLSGREVGISGQIGVGLDVNDEAALWFRDTRGNTYPVTFSAGRTARRALEGCTFKRGDRGRPCTVNGMAEIELDGSRLRLVIYEISVGRTSSGPISRDP